MFGKKLHHIERRVLREGGLEVPKIQFFLIISKTKLFSAKVVICKINLHQILNIKYLKYNLAKVNGYRVTEVWKIEILCILD